MKAFVAGATGAIGRSLVPQLVEAGHEVTAITRSKEKLGELYELGAEAILCDVFDAGRLGSVVARAEPEAVIHMSSSGGATRRRGLTCRPTRNVRDTWLSQLWREISGGFAAKLTLSRGCYEL